jgi:hypothetical protein
MAGLLALLQMRENTTNSPKSMDARISGTEDYLRSALKSWDPQGDAHLPDSLELVLELFKRLQKSWHGRSISKESTARRDLVET